MASGNEIIVTPNPRGVFREGTINGALKPGTFVQVDVSEGEDANGNETYEAYNADDDGDQRQVYILLPDQFRGKLATDAYTDGDHCFVYTPMPGEELNALVKNLAGTADDHSFGDILMIDDGTGKLIATTGSPESEVAQLLEAITDPTEDTLALIRYTGY